MAESVINKLSKTVWVVEIDTSLAVAHKLPSNRKSPSRVETNGMLE